MTQTKSTKIYIAGHRDMVGSAIVRIAPRYFRPTEVETLLGDPSKAKQKLGWVPEITAQEMCAEMVAHNLAQTKQHARRVYGQPAICRQRFCAHAPGRALSD